jgi:hypothetical protein
MTIFRLENNKNYTWKMLVNLEKTIIGNYYPINRLRFFFESEIHPSGIKYSCHDSLNNIYIFDNTNNLCDYLLDIVCKNCINCSFCGHKYINQNKKILKKLNGSCTGNNFSKYLETCNKYCIHCKKWLESLSPEILNLGNKTEKKLIPNIWKIVDNYLKSMDFKCKRCEEIYSSNGEQIFTNDIDDIPYGICSVCSRF